MPIVLRSSSRAFALAMLALAAALPVLAEPPPRLESRFAEVNGTRIHFLIAGRGAPVILIHGYTQTSHMWGPLAAQLATTHTVLAPDLRGAGQSAKPPQGYDKKTLAQDLHALARSGVGDWKSVWLLRDLWHFHFYGEVPLKLVAGRERIYFEHFWNDFAADRTHSVPEADRKLYAAAYAQPGGMRAGFEYFRAFEQDAADFQGFAESKLTMPMLVIAGEKGSGTFLIEQGKLVANDVEGKVVAGSGHWLMEEAPAQVIPTIVEFLGR